MLDWVPVVFITFKATIFAACMFFAIKWHYDQGKKKGADTRTLLLTSGKVVGAFVVGITVLGEQVSGPRVLAAVLIVSGLVLMKLSATE